MQLRELAVAPSPNTEQLTPFCLNTHNQWEFCLNNRTTVDVLQLNFDTKCVDGANVLVSSTIPPAGQPTKKICPNPTKTYNAATETQREELVLDSLLLPETTSTPLDALFVYTKLAPRAVADCGPLWSYLATLTNHGVCSVLRKTLTESVWSPLVDVSSIWLKYCDGAQAIENESDNLFTGLRAKSQNVQLVTFDWLSPCRSPLWFSMVCTTASGKCVFFNVMKDFRSVAESVRVVHVADLEQKGRISHTRWISISKHESYVCTANVLGEVRLYRVSTDSATHDVTDVRLEAVLIKWEMACYFESLSLEYDPEGKRLIVVVCISSRMMIVFVPKDDATTHHMEIHSLDEESITGICTLSPISYVMCTNGGTVQRVQLNSSDTRVEAEVVSTNINTDKYIMCGVSVTENLGIWIFVLYPRQPFDHLILRNSVSISFCSPPTADLLTTLKNNPTHSLTGFMDCFEAIRMHQMRNDDLLKLDHIADAITVDMDGPTFLYDLRLQCMLLATRFAYMRRKDRPELKQLSNEFEFLRKTILAVVFYRRMCALAACTDGHDCTAMQALSIRNIIAFLGKYASEPAHDKYAAVHADICVHLSVGLDLWFNDSNLAPSDDELCHHCDGRLAHGSLECGQGHPNPRCCVTYLQLPVLCSCSCLNCGVVALNEHDLSQVYSCETSSRMSSCPLCDVSFTATSYV